MRAVSPGGRARSRREANFDRWDITEELEDVQVIKGSWTAEVSYLRTWLKSRIAWMEGQLGD